MKTLIAVALWIAIISLALSYTPLHGQTGKASSVGYKEVENWAALPSGEQWHPVSAVTSDAKGNVHTFRRPDAGGMGASIFTFDVNGKFLKSWASGIAKWAHGLRVDRNGFIWTTDGQGNTIKKFSPEGKLLLTLGKYDVAGETPELFNRPTDVAVAENGDFYISDGYGNSRVVKYTKDAKFVKTWGSKGSAPGQFSTPHTIVLDSRGRVLVGDRGNKRVQIFDSDGKFIEQWTHLGAPYGMDISKDDLLYVADGETNKVTIADARDGKLVGVIDGATMVHWVAVDVNGTVYTASNRDEKVKKFVKVR